MEAQLEPKSAGSIIDQIRERRFTLGMSFHPGEKEGTVKLITTGRPPPIYGKSHGDHTLAISGVLRPLEWLLDDVTPGRALERLSKNRTDPTQLERDFHTDLKITFLLGYENASLEGNLIKYPNEGRHLQDLWQLADDAHRKMHTAAYNTELLCPCLSRYLTYVVYLHNFLPLATVVKGSSRSGTGRGEGNALDNLERFEISQSTDVDGMIKNLAQLFDENAIKSQFTQKKENTFASKSIPKSFYPNEKKGEGFELGPLYFERNIVAFQIMGLFRILDALPHTRTLFFRFSALEQNKEEKIAKVIFSSASAKISGKLDEYVKIVEEAVLLIDVMRSKMSNG